MRKLSKPKMNALAAVAEAQAFRLISAGTLAALEKEGLIVQGDDGLYRITEAGQERLNG